MMKDEPAGVVDCFLCFVFQEASDIPFYDRPLWLDPRFGVLVPGIGALAPGYVLLAPREHVPNLAGAVAGAWAGRSWETFLQDVYDHLTATLGSFTFWEHGGSASITRKTSACTDHAHLHVVKGILDLASPEPSAPYPHLIAALRALSARPSPEEEPYLLLGQSKGRCVVAPDPGVPQYYRRQWASLLNKSDVWDYAAVRHLDNSRATIKLFAAMSPRYRG